MAHFAQLDENNVVLRVIVIHNNELLEDGFEIEDKGVAFCKSLYGANTYWKQTSYSGSIRKNYAGIGDTYDFSRDAFISPKPYPSWVLNENTCRWEPSVPYPSDGNHYNWDEDTQSWISVLSTEPSTPPTVI